ncbi:hypothetical protein Hamer_G026408 [Homarus americanus]|uniref:Uncharacterized protein n=1 Tax=Homarus americanus TaxID=6706 RepID=A0A8J5MRV3_HOMAM|nr:hypothetical protein Hamer_G026408 [Homarus americanus]
MKLDGPTRATTSGQVPWHHADEATQPEIKYNLSKGRSWLLPLSEGVIKDLSTDQSYATACPSNKIWRSASVIGSSWEIGPASHSCC